MADIRRVLVVGGGVGGLTAATAIARRGVDAGVLRAVSIALARNSAGSC